jgi:hypothetical protein
MKLKRCAAWSVAALLAVCALATGVGPANADACMKQKIDPRGLQMPRCPLARPNIHVLRSVGHSVSQDELTDFGN